MSSSGLNLEKFLIPLDEIERATKNFSSETRIGDGTFGEVYKGQLSEPWNNCTAAIKCLFSNEYQGKDEFLHELKMISSFDHENIIRFIGYCDEGKHMIIVSEYASNGSLDDHLGDPNKIRYITWEQRLKICLGVAKGLDYLHLGLKDYNSVIHRDIKSGNILLDDNMEAKICDFGLSVSSSTHRNQIINLHAAGTNFYLDPLYRESGFLWKESDIYSLGVVMFEMLSGMLAYDTRSLGDDKPQPLINLVRRYYDDGLDRLIDPHIRDDIHTLSFLEFENIAYQCISLDLEQRPWMHQIIGSLKYALDVQMMNINTSAVEGKFDNTHSNDYEDPNDYAVKIKEIHSNIHDEEIPKIKRLFSTMSTIQSQEYQKTMSSSGLKLQKFLIPLEEINRATKSFTSEMIGDGGFGKVYKGQLSEQWQSRTAAIKRLDQKSYEGKRETFLNELNMISGFQHKNIIPFIGYCDEGNEFIIVSEYASNGSLDDHLIDPKKSHLLTWAERLKICLGSAKGINYLHSGLGDDNRVIHRDVKSANILLDGNMEAKICDFGLSKSGPRNQQHTQLYTNVAGTFSYMDPVFQESGILRKESDVYSFGVVMFEMLSGMLAYKERSIGSCEPQYLINLVRSNYYDGLYNLIDQHIEDHIDLKSFDTVKEIAYQCLSFKFEERPKMDGIIKRIEEALNIQESSLGNSRSTLLKDQREILPSSRGVHRINFYGIQEWTKYQ